MIMLHNNLQIEIKTHKKFWLIDRLHNEIKNSIPIKRLLHYCLSLPEICLHT